MAQQSGRESIAEIGNPLAMEGIEFVEYSTSKPQALGQVLETMGFRPIARHRSREVLLYRQGEMNVIVNAHAGGQARAVRPSETPVIAAIALRVRDASAAYRLATARGAWIVPSNVEVMELNIPAIHGVGSSRIYFVDRYRDFSIYDVDFTLNPGVDPHPPALTGLHWFGIVQYIGNDRTADWTEFYTELFGFKVLPDETEPVPQLLPAADRADAGNLRGRTRRDAATAGTRHARRAGHSRGASQARRGVRRVAGRAFREAGGAHAKPAWRRHVRTRAR